MKIIQLKNGRLETLLSNTIELFYTGEAKKITKEAKERKDNLITDYHPCSDEYLFEAFKHDRKKFGYPRAAYGCNVVEVARNSLNKKELPIILKNVSNIGKFLGTPVNALTISYPDNGYIGWHHNGNSPGHNILFSYSLDGDGSFCFWDYETKSIKRLYDTPGWNVKVGYYPSEKKEPDKLYWHMAQTKKHRVSIAFIIDQKEMWKNMIDEITLGDYDENIILYQGKSK